MMLKKLQHPSRDQLWPCKSTENSADHHQIKPLLHINPMNCITIYFFFVCGKENECITRMFSFFVSTMYKESKKQVRSAENELKTSKQFRCNERCKGVNK